MARRTEYRAGDLMTAILVSGQRAGRWSERLRSRRQVKCDIAAIGKPIAIGAPI